MALLTMKPECLTDEDVAALLGHKLPTFRKKRPALEADGFPKKHPILKLYFLRDVMAWIENSRQIRENNLSSGDHSTEEPHLGEV